MPLPRDYAEIAIDQLKKAIDLSSRISDIVESNKISSKIEDCLEIAASNINWFSDVSGSNRLLEKAGEIIFPLDPAKQSRVLIADQCNIAIDYIYEGIGEMRPVNDPDQLSLNLIF